MQSFSQNRIAICLFSLFATVVLCSIPLYAADESGYTIRASANEVRLSFAVSDRQGHVIKTLRPSDVAVADNGSIIRHFRSFRPASESPLDLVILLDASDSVASRIPEEIAQAKSFVKDSTWGPRDRVSILAFGGMQPMLLCALKCSAKEADLKLSSLRANGLTPLYDALFQAAEMLDENRDPESRSAMILFSDGVDTISMHSGADAIQAAQNLQAAIYSVNTRSRKAWGDGDAELAYLAASTGGLSYGPGEDVANVLGAVLEDLHSGYVLTYELPAQPGGQHAVRLLPTSDPKLQFRSRRGYDRFANE
jgi:VWFA-related protein